MNVLVEAATSSTESTVVEEPAENDKDRRIEDCPNMNGLATK